MQASSSNISEGKERLEELISQAAGIVAAAKGVMKIRHVMKLVGFTQEEICSMTIYQRVRWQSLRLSIVDTQVVATMPKVLDRPVSQVNLGSGDTVTSTLSSAERTGDVIIDTIEGSGNSNNNTSASTTVSTSRVAATPRRLEASGNGK